MPGIRVALCLRAGLLAAAALCSSFLACAADAPKPAAGKPGEPTDPKASKTYREALDWLKARKPEEAVEAFRKAARQDGHCSECLRQAYVWAARTGNYKAAEEIARESLPLASSDLERSVAHYRIAMALQRQGIEKRKDKCFDESCGEFKTAMQLEPKLTGAHFDLGVSLAHLHQDDAARSEFSTFLASDTMAVNEHERAQRFLDRIELARARMAPPFSVTTLDSRQVSLDSLAGKVVLIDFWATWCGPCREALPHIREIARRFQEQPLVVISISLDKDEAKWKDFVLKNQMTWLQYRDGSFDGPIAKSFGVTAIPATFTIDADGVLEDEHVGDANIESKLKKLLANTSRKPPATGLQDRTAAEKTIDDPQ